MTIRTKIVPESDDTEPQSQAPAKRRRGGRPAIPLEALPDVEPGRLGNNQKVFADDTQICGARATTTGKPCRNRPVPGRDRCKFHGGAVPRLLEDPTSNVGGGQALNLHAAKPGSVYSQFLSLADQRLMMTMNTGTVDDEILMTKVRLARWVKAKAEFEERMAGRTDMEAALEVESVTEREGGELFNGAHTEKTYKLKDYDGQISKLTLLIERLERTKKEIEQNNAGDGQINITVTRAVKE